MSFLQPLLLMALPLVSLPIIIHLINQRRYQTMQWAAMMFLLAANRMSRGYARLRRWLILLFRMLVIAGLIFAISRPLASGWLGLSAGERVDTTLILLDRSPSMQQQGAGGTLSKLQTGRDQLVRALSNLDSLRWVLIESAAHAPLELESPETLLALPETEATSAAADLPAMLRAAHDYLEANQAGRTEIWICSDLRANDWDDRSGRWQALRESFLRFNQRVRFNLLAYPEAAVGNKSIRVTDLRREATNDGYDLLLSIALTGSDDAGGSIPVQFEIDGARSELNVEMQGAEYELKDYRISLGRNQQRGWGRVSIPADSNPADDEFYFTFDEPTPRRTIVVAEDLATQRPLELAAAISPDATLASRTEALDRSQLETAEWDDTGLLLWQGTLPEGAEVEWIEGFVDRGGRVIFFPPSSPNKTEFRGAGWGEWVEADDGVLIDTWRSDQDLLARTQSGAALPVGKLQIRRYCQLNGEFTALAELRGGRPLLTRITTTRGGVYFCSTTVTGSDSSLAVDGVVLYVAVQRALAEGAAELAKARQVIAGEPPPFVPASWHKLAGDEHALSTMYPYHAGVYRAEDHLLAVNRSEAEDRAQVLADPRLGELFGGLDFVRVNDRAGNIRSLVQEIWRLFMLAMMLAMISEAALCIPRLRSSAGAVS